MAQLKPTSNNETVPQSQPATGIENPSKAHHATGLNL
jgi:hypothetical protein